MNFHSLKICKLVSETQDSVTISFEIPQNLKNEFVFNAGQYLTLRTSKGGNEIRRAYSICSIPDNPIISVTVKKVKGGLMSEYLTSQIKEGDFIDVMTPEGNFVLLPDHSLSRAHFFICAGSGITPVLSMIQTVLEHEPKSVCLLLYGSKDENNIIFGNTLDNLVRKYENQLFVEHVLSQPTIRKEGGIAGLFGKKIRDWQGYSGRITEALLADFLSKYNTNLEDKHYYLCGPGDLIQRTTEFLEKENISKKCIHKEYFSSTNNKSTENKGVIQSTVTVTLKSETFEIVVPSNKTILDILVELKKDPPYSCTSGACSTCMAKVTNGIVKMDSCYALEDDEVAAGYILTCQSRPITEDVALTYDV